MRQGQLIEEDGISYLARNENLAPDDVMAPLQAAASTWRIAAGPRAGRKVLTFVGGIGLARRELWQARELCTNAQGFSLHAGVHLDANDRRGIELLRRQM